MLAWMLYAIVASLLIGAAAAALAYVLHSLRRPTRFAWVGAMLLSVAWPVLMLMFPPDAATDAPAPTIRSTVSAGMHTVSNTVARASERTLNVSVETMVLAIWVALSALLIARVIYAFHTNARRAKGWRFATVDGIEVRTSADVGPAVVGVASMQVVLPEWVLTLDRSLLDLVMAHEEEHRSARDPLLLFGAALAVCAMPWNLALIWQARRLRGAMEVDCDARVLRRYPDTERYGLLLLAIAQRRSATTLLGATMSEPAVNLSRRFAAMKNVSLSRVRIAGLCTFGVAAIIAACAIDAPTAPGPAMSSESSNGDVRLAYATIDTSKTMKYCVDGTNGYSDICLEFPERAQGFDERTMLELTEKLLVDYTRALERTGSTTKAFNAAYADVAKIEKLIGETITVMIDEVTLPAPSQERMIVEAKHKPKVPELTATFATDSAGKVTLAPVELPPKRIEHDAEIHIGATDPPLVPGTLSPVYPAGLRDGGYSGLVRVSVVIDADGRADLSTFRVEHSDHADFTKAVRAALSEARFKPPMVDGRAVRQLATFPITFSIK